MRNFRRTAMAVCLAVMSTISIPAAASAASINDSFSESLESNVADLGSFGIQGVDPNTGTVFDLQVTGHAVWTGDLATAIGFNSNDVRQGGDLVVSRVSLLQTGKIKAQWDVTGLVSPFGQGGFDIGTITIGVDDVGCQPTLGGSAYDCIAKTSGVDIVNTPGVPNSPYIKAALEATFTITPEAAVIHRTLTLDGTPAAPAADLALSTSVLLDETSVPCTAPVGADLLYSVSSFHWTPDVHVNQGPHVIIGQRDPSGFVELPAYVDEPWGVAVQADPSFDLAGLSHTTDLGTIQANNVAPEANAGAAQYGVLQGKPLALDGSASSSACGFPTLRWDFSDGGVAWGKYPQHTFQGAGMYSGILTATDATGLASTDTFAIDVTNADPIANAGPDTSAAWGKAVSFSGSAVDGADDLATLSYSWSFGDGSAAASGASVMHSFSAPGTYTATLTVKDQHGASGTDTRLITVDQRGVTSAFLGNDGTFDTAGLLRASFTDQYGNPVVGRSIQFSIAGVTVGSAQTNASGVATLAWTPTFNAGSYLATATFAGDSLYGSASDIGTINVDKKATTVTYTGATNGGPNKTVTLSAVLKDATGKALAGRTITFKLGSQTVTAVTDANGLAKTGLQLSQKNGSYPLTATFAPTGSDDLHYIGSGSATNFSLKK